MILSSYSSVPLEDVAKANGDDGLRWFQLYVFRDKELTRSLIKRAETSGYKALVITVDTPVMGRKVADIWNRVTQTSPFASANFTASYNASSLATDKHESGVHQYAQPVIDPSMSWETIDWVRGITKLPILLKGILTREDATEALKHGVQGIVVSNHGGRQLDGVPATVSYL